MWCGGVVLAHEQQVWLVSYVKSKHVQGNDCIFNGIKGPVLRAK
ncbi:hypothetical protein B6254_0306 [Weissella cibaria]|uniref:Uncharacterized protein n=1 Tax=Weissella cibaria TaxID=137591 RepID=A0A2S1KP00_9LACO|nr:hypothetical protein B6254_0306 [Weissella cibaria]